jgi:PAS domain S-box-containing protein
VIPHGVVVPASHDLRIVTLSVIVSILGAYASMHLAERVRDARGTAWAGWLAGAAATDAIGTWSMHYTGKLAIQSPIALQLDWRMVVLSWVVSMVGSAAALIIAGRGRIAWGRAIVAGVFLGGVGVSGLHFTAMAAIKQPQLHHHHSPLLLGLSIVFAISIASVALPFTFVLWDSQPRRSVRRHASALLRGSANPVMHYMAMAAVVFVVPNEAPNLTHTVSIASLGIIGISVVPVTVLVVALLTSVVDRLQKQRALLDELFDQAPEPVVLMTEDERIVRVNREFTVVFGYTKEESRGRRLRDLIGRSEGHMRGREAEGFRHRKDGTTLSVAELRVPVSMPAGEVQIYAILRDISEKKRAEEELRSLPRKLMEAQETVGRDVARELHDEIGQILTGIGMLLSIPDELPSRSQSRLEEARRAIQELSGRVRTLALDLRPSMLDDFGLVAALEWLLQRYTRQTGVAVDLVHAGVDRRFSTEVEVAVYRIVQEALTNVARHAGAGHAVVNIEAKGQALRITVKDGGRGFNHGAAYAGVGLAGMRERATILGGGFEIASSPGDGTQVSAWLPFQDVSTAP